MKAIKEFEYSAVKEDILNTLSELVALKNSQLGADIFKFQRTKYMPAFSLILSCGSPDCIKFDLFKDSKRMYVTCWNGSDEPVMFDCPKYVTPTRDNLYEVFGEYIEKLDCRRLNGCDDEEDVNRAQLGFLKCRKLREMTFLVLVSALKQYDCVTNITKPYNGKMVDFNIGSFKVSIEFEPSNNELKVTSNLCVGSPCFYELDNDNIYGFFMELIDDLARLSYLHHPHNLPS